MSTATILLPKRNLIEGRLARFAEFIKSGAFPVWMLSLLVFYQAFLAIMVFAPPFGAAWGTFAEDFLIKCFDYNPDTGAMKWAAFWVMIGEPLPIEILLLTLWRKSLAQFIRTRTRALVPVIGSSLGVVIVIAGSLMFMWRADAAKPEEIFPGDRIRSNIAMPHFALTNQDGEKVALSQFKGRVLLLTAVYSTCTKTCPMLLTQIRVVVNKLTPEEKKKLSIVAFSLNPEQDTRELRTMTTRIFGFKSPEFHFVNGDAVEVNRLLDDLKISREKNAETGEIQHANLFYLVDAKGTIAYRLSLSNDRPTWLLSATRDLLSEVPDASHAVK